MLIFTFLCLVVCVWHYTSEHNKTICEKNFLDTKIKYLFKDNKYIKVDPQSLITMVKSGIHLHSYLFDWYEGGADSSTKVYYFEITNPADVAMYPAVYRTYNLLFNHDSVRIYIDLSLSETKEFEKLYKEYKGNQNLADYHKNESKEGYEYVLNKISEYQKKQEELANNCFNSAYETARKCEKNLNKQD